MFLKVFKNQLDLFSKWHKDLFLVSNLTHAMYLNLTIIQILKMITHKLLVRLQNILLPTFKGDSQLLFSFNKSQD